jgi:hypothetical protein
MDYSFSGLNQAMVPLAPTMAMQFGNTIHRLLQRIAYADPSLGPVYLAKFDLSDGFYRIRLTPAASLALAVLLPGPTDTDHLIGIPLSLPMGWTDSPPYFSAFTETAADLANMAIATADPHPPPHQLEAASQAPPVVKEATFHPAALHPLTPALLPTPLSYADVYVDDFIGLCHPQLASQTLRHILHAISAVFRHDPHPDDAPARKQIISASKLAQGDGAWSTTKVVLGWQLDTAAKTLALPSHKADRLHTIIASFLQLGRTSRRKWQQLLGELRHMATAIRGASYLFSILQHVLVDQPNTSRLRLPPLVKSSLADWQLLARSLAVYPVPITSLVPRAPSYVAAVDASGQGCGGIILPTRLSPVTTPLAFRWPFPLHIVQQLVSASNPSGTITNSDLELAAIVLGVSTLTSVTPTNYDLLLCASDNTPAVAWCTKGSSSSVSPNAFLLRLLAQLGRQHKVDVNPVSVPGHTNDIADFCSRSFSLSDQAFAHELNSRFPIYPGWTIVPPTPSMQSQVTSCLLRELLPWASVSPEPTPPLPLGTSGVIFAPPLALPTPPSSTYTTPYPSSNCSLIATDWASFLPAKLLSAAERWAMPFVPLARRSPAWAVQIPGCNLQVN